MTGEVGREAKLLYLLVLRCQAGDEQAFGRLIAAFGPKTLRYLQGLLNEDAEDAQQDVWLTVYRNIRGLANPAAFRTWLFRTTRHRAIDFLRRRRRERELLDDTPVEEAAAEATGNDHEVDSIDESVTIDESATMAALMAIPPPQREVLLLRYRDDLSYQEIAQVVGCPLGTVKTRLYHAKRHLQETLERGLER